MDALGTSLGEQFGAVYRLLKQTQPVEDYDVVWHGAYYIPRPREWCPSRFMLYRGTLYASLLVEGDRHEVGWQVGSGVVRDASDLRGATVHPQDAALWADALSQIEHRLAAALRDFTAYNNRVERLLPPTCRTGVIQRRLIWPKDAEPPVPVALLEQFEHSVAGGDGPRRPVEAMTLSTYLAAAAVAYDAAFEELRPLAPIEKYRRRADGRDDGMLDLPPDDADAFAAWLSGGRHGGHPWEIVFAHPHGILLSPHRRDDGTWSYYLSVDTEGWYVSAARIAIALAEHDIPFEFFRWEDVAAALRGIDDVTVGGHGWHSLSYEELIETRPDAVDAIRWDPIPQLAPITDNQAKRVTETERPGEIR